MVDATPEVPGAAERSAPALAPVVAEPSVATDPVLVDRYGTAPHPHARARVLALAIAGGLVATGALVMVAFNLLAPQAQFKDVGFVLHGPDRTSVTFEVQTPAGRGAHCRLVALDQGYGEVGVLDVTVPPNEGRTLRATYEIATVSLAVTGVVDSCTLLDD